MEEILPAFSIAASAEPFVNVGLLTLLLTALGWVLYQLRTRNASPTQADSILVLPHARTKAQPRRGLFGLLTKRSSLFGHALLVVAALAGSSFGYLTLGLRLTSAATQVWDLSAQISDWRSQTPGAPKVEFLPPVPPSVSCGLFDVSIRLRDGSRRQSFIAVRDRRLNRLHNVLRALPSDDGRFEAQLGAYFGGGDYDVVVITPKHAIAETAMRSAEVVVGGRNPAVEGIPAPDVSYAFYAWGPRIHVPTDCNIKDGQADYE